MQHIVYFSPSGTTKATAQTIAIEFPDEYAVHDITVKGDAISIEPQNDMVLLAAPVYAGRIPPLAAERFSLVKGNGQKAIVVVVYGNRDYDDALLELCDIATKQGFKVVAAGAFIGEHCIFPKVATERPDADDILKIKEFATAAKEALATDSLLNTTV